MSAAPAETGPGAGTGAATGADTGAEPAEVIVEQRGRLGLLTLNRPRAINALTHGMVRLIAEALDRWADDDTVATVAVVGSGERGLCAGGDVVSLYRDVTEADGLGAAAFWRDEYTMNARIASYPKPFVAIQDGIVLGGGIGVSAHGSHRIVTERSKLGFPEVTIGFVPDVGATWLLSRAPGELGTRLALSAASIGPADAILVGFSDSFVPSDRLPKLLKALEFEDAATVIEALATEPGPGVLDAQRDWTDEVFAGDSVTDIIERLRDHAAPEASALAESIDQKSPLALAVTLESLRRARELPGLTAALDQEYRVSRHSSAAPDFAEGIRAQLVDKDRNPKWSPSSHAAVAAADVSAVFETPSDGDLGLAAADGLGLPAELELASKETS
ncbi:enoyl-CoA hydratase/isomerase family protein [Agromyces aerolatus]|uniref:enoyl-CoA hydratase/isomerase family protein n=1 Tax=Agromyces sp. LY-1074 TaxID=3074080 RepID=UPI002865C70B|nr:enoyl-CoA hydratase/isomerase family protein [Agromyces sp. LY-1358]MDR5706151.1 enoyl-CoA hydratase/isomerase family protein [Agromyces sp. LY-1358]